MSTLRMYRGDTQLLDVVVVDEAGAAVDISGSDIRFTAKRKPSDPDLDAIITKTLGSGIDLVGGGLAGECQVTIDPVDTDSLTKQTTLTWDLQLVDGGGAVKTAAFGRLMVLVDISRTAP